MCTLYWVSLPSQKNVGGLPSEVERRWLERAEAAGRYFAESYESQASVPNGPSVEEDFASW